MNSATERRDVPDIVLERYRLGELPRADAEDVERRLGEEPALRDRLEAIETSDLEMERTGLTDRLAAGVRARAARSNTATRPLEGPGATSWLRLAAVRWLVPAAVGVAALAVVIVSLPGARTRLGFSSSSPFGQLEEGGRVKGLEPSLTLFRKTALGTERIEPGSTLHAGDLVRVAYQAAGRPYGAVLSVDGRGAVTLHLPASGQASARLQPGDRVLLEQAYELDDAPRWEKFYLVTAQTPFDLAPILDAARRAGAAAGSGGPAALAIAPELEQVGVLFIKEGQS